jgi:thiol-disulfide isomerase/thioredoxin
MLKALLTIMLVFTLVSCNENKLEQIQENTVDAASEAALSKESSLGQFLLNSSKPAVIKFYAEWCSTCKKYDPSYREVSAKMGNVVDFYEINVDDNQYKELLKQLKISRIPETVFINLERTNVTKKLGSISRDKLEKLIETQLL